MLNQIELRYGRRPAGPAKIHRPDGVSPSTSANAQHREVPLLDRAADASRTQNGISSSSGSEGTADFGGAAVGFPLERDCRSSSVVSAGPLATALLGRLPSNCI